MSLKRRIERLEKSYQLEEFQIDIGDCHITINKNYIINQLLKDIADAKTDCLSRVRGF